MDLNKQHEAGPLIWESLEARREALGNAAPATIESMYAWAKVLAFQDKKVERLSLLREILTLLPAEERSTSNALYFTGLVLRDLKKYAEAEPLLMEALEARRAKLGDVHDDTISALGGYANFLKLIGRREEGAKLMRQCAEECRDSLGIRHKTTQQQMSNLASHLSGLGQLDEAETLLKEAVAVMRETFGGEDGHTCRGLNDLGLVLWKQGKRDEAAELMEEAAGAYRKVYGPHHSHTKVAEGNLQHLRAEIAEIVR